MNYYEIERFSLSKYRRFMFVDSLDCAAKSEFFKLRIRIKVKEVLAKPGEDYQFVICDVEKKNAGKFEQAMESLKNTMLILGHMDYEEKYKQMLGQVLS